jgi:TatD DNase family protein
VRSPQKQKLVAALPLDRLVLETDAPALGPEKGVTNRPANITVARDEVARIKGIAPSEVERVTTANALQLFPLLRRWVGNGDAAGDDGEAQP